MGKGKKTWIEKNGLVLGLGAGVLVAVFGRQWFEKATTKFVNGIGYKFHSFKLKFTSLSNLRVTGIMTLINQNAFGGQVSGFEGELLFGKNGQQIVPVNVGPFNLPGRGEADADIISNVNPLTLAGNLLTAVTSIANGDIKQLWVRGKLRATFFALPLPINDKVDLLNE
jgi:hypothetical protein